LNPITSITSVNGTTLSSGSISIVNQLYGAIAIVTGLVESFRRTALLRLRAIRAPWGADWACISSFPIDQRITEG